MNKSFSLRVRLILSFLTVSVGVWIVSGIMAWHESREYMDEFFDTYQILLARQLSAVEWQSIKPETQKKVDKIIENLDDDGEEEEEALGFAVFDKQGNMVFNDGENGRLFKYSHYTGFVNQSIGHKKKKWRIIRVNTVDENYIVAVGQEIKYRNEAAMELALQSLAPWGFALGFLILASVFLVNRGLKPLRFIARNLLRRKPNDLSPLEVSDLPREIEPLVAAMNRLFIKINDMVERERGFIADSAHELRSPLTALKVQLDVVMLAKKDEKTRNKALSQLALGIERSGRLVEQLLTLSRLEAGQTAKEEDNLDWQKIVGESIADLQSEINEKGLTISTDIREEEIIAKGSSFLWSLLVRNLVDNAVKYSPNKANIKIEIKKDVLKVANSGVELEKNVLENLSKRFYRPAGQEQNGSGLGLSIVERIAHLYDCQLTFENKDKVFTVVVKKNAK